MEDNAFSQLVVLWRQVCKNDSLRSYELLFYQLNRNLVLFCNTFIHNEGASEELVSDVFIYLWNNRSALLKVENPKAYLYTAVKNKALNYLKKFPYSHLEIDYSEEIELVDYSDPNVLLERKEFFLKIDHIIAQLPNQTLLVFRLIKEDGMKYQEVADLLNISPRTVQTHMRRAFQKISTLLRQYKNSDKHLINRRLLTLLHIIAPLIH
jgi:RNA polymerase sigma-70 factor (ECF subfamily)